jgi:hypothetical protein
VSVCERVDIILCRGIECKRFGRVRADPADHIDKLLFGVEQRNVWRSWEARDTEGDPLLDTEMEWTTRREVGHAGRTSE